MAGRLLSQHIQLTSLELMNAIIHCSLNSLQALLTGFFYLDFIKA